MKRKPLFEVYSPKRDTDTDAVTARTFPLKPPKDGGKPKTPPKPPKGGSAVKIPKSN